MQIIAWETTMMAGTRAATLEMRGFAATGRAAADAGPARAQADRQRPRRATEAEVPAADAAGTAVALCTARGRAAARGASVRRPMLRSEILVSWLLALALLAAIAIGSLVATYGGGDPAV